MDVVGSWLTSNSRFLQFSCRVSLISRWREMRSLLNWLKLLAFHLRLYSSCSSSLVST